MITRERIVVLFFFCTDLAILALQQDHIELFHRLVRWTLNYLKGKICMWVAKQGGWVSVDILLFFLLKRTMLFLVQILGSVRN